MIVRGLKSRYRIVQTNKGRKVYMKKIINRFIHLFTLFIINFSLNYNGVRVFGGTGSLYSKWIDFRIKAIRGVLQSSIREASIFMLLTLIVDIFIIRDIYIILKELKKDYKN